MSNNGNNLAGLSADAQMAWRMNLYAIKTQQHLANKELAEREAGLRVEAQLEGQAVMAKILEENERKAAVEAYQMRELQNRNLEAELKERFMLNPAATENSWILAKAQIKQAYFIERFNAEKSRDEIEAEKYAGFRM